MIVKKILWQHGIGLLLAMLIGPIVWMAADNNAPVIVEKQWIEGDLVPGGRFNIVWQARSLRPNCEGLVRRRIVSAQSGVVFEYAATNSVIHSDDNRTRIFKRELELPKSIPSGEAVHEVITYYQCNWVQRFLNIYIKVQRQPLTLIIGE